MTPALFTALNDIDAATAKRRFDIQTYPASAKVISEGDVGRSMAVLVRGSVRVEAGGTEVARLEPGAVVGEMGLFEDSIRTASVTAITPVEFWVLPRTGYEELRDTVHPICLAIENATLDAQVGRLEAVGARVAKLGLGVPTAVEPPRGFFAAVARLFGNGGLTRASGSATEPLGASPLFADAPPAALELIAQQFEPFVCEGGAFVCTEGEVGRAMFVLESGAIDVIVNMEGTPHQVDSLGPGAAFGMVSLARRGTRMASCVANDGARVHRLDAAGWDLLIGEPYMVGSTFRRAVIRAFSDQLRYSNLQLAKWESTLNTEYGLAAKRGLSVPPGG